MARTPPYLAKVASGSSNTHEIILCRPVAEQCDGLRSLPGLIRQTHRKIRAASADGAYDTRSVTMNCGVRKSQARLSCPEGAGYCPVNMQTVTVLLRISG